MFAYSTVSPYYFDYLASIYTREDILNDERLCHLLENPYTKDNMEMALHWKDAKRGGEKEKRKFIEYFFANGPELEPDTILYYREKCLQNPIYVELAEIVINSVEINIDDLRTQTYGKRVDDGNCFTNPCNYLGPLSSSIGMMGDSYNFLTLSNIFAKLLKSNDKDEKEDDKKTGEGTKDDDGVDSVWGHIRRHVANKIIPSIRIGIQGFYDNMKNDMKEFTDKIAEAGLGKHISLGDPVSIDRSEAISAATKMNVMNRMGDCARLWQHMRQYNPYDGEKNTKGPISDDMLEKNKATSGTSIDNTPSMSAVKSLSPSNVSSMAAANDPVAKAMKLLQELEWPYTADEINTLSDPNTPQSKIDEIITNKTDDVLRKIDNRYREVRDQILREADDSIVARLQDEIQKLEDERYGLGNQYWELVNAIREQREKSEKVKEEGDEEDNDEKVDYTITGAPDDEDDNLSPSARMAKEAKEKAGIEDSGFYGY